MSEHFRSKFSRDIFTQRYSGVYPTWPELAQGCVHGVVGGLVPQHIEDEIVKLVVEQKFIPGGRYLWYAGRQARFWNNCYLLKSEEDTREDWSNLSFKATSCLMTGGGIGNDYSIYRASGLPLARTGGQSSGPLPAMEMVNEIGRRVMQGGSRRSAIYASLNWRHGNIYDFIRAKDWDQIPLVPGESTTYGDMKKKNFSFPCPLDYTNISVNYDDAWLNLPDPADDPTFLLNCEHALRTGEPGFSFNFGDKQNETARNACTEVCSEDDSDVCNLGSLNMAQFHSLSEFKRAVYLSTIFLLCGTLRADLPYAKVYHVREKNRRLGLGLMGVHEWLLQRGYRYDFNEELGDWLGAYETWSDNAAQEWAAKLNVSEPVAKRAIAPTGTIGILAGTTTGIEPLFAVAYRRRYLKNLKYHVQYVIEPIAENLIRTTGIQPDEIETALSLAADPERRIRFQAAVQRYVDQSISSTINLPEWGSALNNPQTVAPFARILAKYAPYLRGFTAYPDGARGGQPLALTSYDEAKAHVGAELVEESADICSISGKGGTCGV